MCADKMQDLTQRFAYDRIIRPIILKYVGCVFVKIHSFTWGEEICLTTFKIIKNKCLNTENEGLVDIGDGVTVENYRDLEVYEELILGTNN